MEKMKCICLLCCIGLIVGCSAIRDVKYDYDQQADFNNYRSYDWMPAMAKEDMSDLVMARVEKAVDAELAAKGLKKNSQNPDFLIAQHLGKKDKVRVTDWGYDYYGYYSRYPGGYWGGPWGPGRISTYEYEEGTLILDFIDAGSKKLFWRGSAKADVQNVDSPEKSEKLINEAVQKILENYPPEKK